MWDIISTEEIQDNVFHLIDKEWMLVSAAKPDGTKNAMTASWGGLGSLWGRHVAFVFVRPQRYTKEFVEESEKLSLSFFGGEYRKMLIYMGTKSGRDEDKIAGSDLHVELVDGAPVYAESRMTLICRKLYAQDMKPECFTVPAVDAEIYPTKDYHTTYICEIEKVLVRR